MRDLPRFLEGEDKGTIRIAQAVLAILVDHGDATLEERWGLGTGFVVAIGGEWLLITADHVLDGIEKALSDNAATKVSLRALIDHQPMETIVAYKPEDRIPIRAGSERVLETTTDLPERLKAFLTYARAIDIGVLILRDYYVQNLVAAGVIPLTRDDLWRLELPELLESLQSQRITFYAVGFPRNGLRTGHDGDLDRLACKYLPLWPDVNQWPVLDFVPNWEDPLHFGSVQGMSGGPVVAVIDEEVHWFGVQASEYAVPGKTPKKLYVAEALSLFDFLELLHAIGLK